MTNESAVDEPMVRFADVQKTYDGETLVVKNLQLDIAKGEFVTMLGPSGSGKTTCLMMLAGFEPATHGEIFLNGKPINKVPPHKRGIGMVFQNYALFPHMSVSENLAFPLKVRKMGQADVEARVKRALDMVELSQFSNRMPAQLSGGQQQRVAVARAIVGGPSIVLADEPTGNLDSKNGEIVMGLLRDLHREGATICMVTHDPRYAKHADRTIHLFDGRVVEDKHVPRVEEEMRESGFHVQ
jgi:putative spermidine/putrescine transport system ATP-binding protein